MPELKAILWDHDGTLVDTEPYWIDAQLEMAAQWGVNWTEEDSLACVGSPMTESAYRIQQRGVDMGVEEIIVWQVDRVIELVQERGARYLPGVFELFEEMKAQGVRGAIVSNAWRKIVEVNAAGLPQGVIERILAGDEMVHAKPDPWPYASTAEAMGVPVENCIAIEDSLVGTLSAEAAGMKCLTVPSMLPVPAHEGRSQASTLEGITLDTLRSILNGEVLDQADPAFQGHAR